MTKPDLHGLGIKILKKLTTAACAVLPVAFVVAVAAFGVRGLTAAAEARARSAAMRHIAAPAQAAAPEPGEKTTQSEPPSPSGSSPQSEPVPKDAPEEPPLSGKTLQVKNIQQLPELKAGCEVTSAAIVLNYLGYDVKKTELVGYLNRDANFRTVNGKLYGPDPWTSFAGDPADKYGCYAPVITDMANRYLRAVKSDRTAVNISGAAPVELYSCIDSGFPVVVWATTFMEEPSVGPEWYLNDTGEYYQWILKEHSLVLTGYTENTVVFSDPLDERGTVTYDRALFELRYAQMYSQAVLIH